MYQYKLLFFLITIIAICDCLNILFVITYFGKSHYIVFKNLINRMSKNGHNVYLITRTKVSKNGYYPVIDIASELDMMPIDAVARNARLEIYKILFFHDLCTDMCCSKLENEKFQEFIRKNITFDVIATEVFNTNCFQGLQSIFKAPIVGLSTTDFLPWMYQWFGCPENPSYIPVLFMDYADKMNFLQRVENTLMLIFSKLYHYYHIAPSGNEYSKKYLGVDLYQGGDILYNMSLLLMNRHYSYHTPKPLTPNVIEVGGIHIQTPKSLPQELEKIVNASEHGVIFMSMGSTLKGTTFPEKQRKLFLKVFSQLNQTIIWKWENDTMEDLPANVRVQKWLPQLDLLCHPNLKLFITHGGLLGTQEGVYCAKPMLILPLFADQHYNAAVLAKSGATLSLKLSTATEEDLRNALHKLLTPEFSKNAVALSERFKDRPMSPMDTAIYWIEYVARHKGAPFMKSAVTELPFYQSLLLDVIAFLILIMAILIGILYFILKRIVRTCVIRSGTKIKTN